MNPSAGRKAAACWKTTACWIVVFSVSGCAANRATRPPITSEPAATAASGDSIPALAADIKALAARADSTSGGAALGDLAAQAHHDAEACLAIDATAALCQYGQAVALGLEVRAHPTRAPQLLSRMLQALSGADAVDANYDHAGPSRVRALVLLRAPGWPLGPGDDDGGLQAARHAVELQPDYPPNLLALAEGLGKTGDADGSVRNFRRARELAQAAPPSTDRDDWLKQAEQGLHTR